jgi:Ni,Fe-hydrogenase III large subunit
MDINDIDPDFIEGAVKLTDLDEAIIGVAEEFTGNRIVYSKNKVLEILQRDMSEEDAIEYYYYNILGLYASEQNPVFLVD